MRDENQIGIGAEVVACVGAWDILHLGHILFLERAAALGGTLIIGVLSDQATFELHREEAWKPLQPLENRLPVVQSLRQPDIVLPLMSLDIEGWLRAIGATVFAVSEEDAEKAPFEAAIDWMMGAGRRVEVLPRTPDLSTEKIVGRYVAWRRERDGS